MIGDTTAFKGTPIIWLPYLEEDVTAPAYGPGIKEEGVLMFSGVSLFTLRDGKVEELADKPIIVEAVKQ